MSNIARDVIFADRIVQRGTDLVAGQGGRGGEAGRERFTQVEAEAAHLEDCGLPRRDGQHLAPGLGIGFSDGGEAGQPQAEQDGGQGK